MAGLKVSAGDALFIAHGAMGRRAAVGPWDVSRGPAAGTKRVGSSVAESERRCLARERRPAEHGAIRSSTKRPCTTLRW